MARVALVLAVTIADTALLWLDRPTGPALAAYALLTAFVMVVRTRMPMAAFLVALPMALLSGGAFALLICTSFQAGHRLASRADAATVIGGTVAYVGVLLVLAGPAPPEPWTVTARAVVLIALPMAGGRYHAQHRELIAALRRQGELSVERERLRERLRIARDMHDSLGHRLGLVSVQAAALEVARLPEREHQALRQLADAARDAMDELHELVGTLRRPDEDSTPGLAGIGELVAAFRRAGVVVTEQRSGDPRPLPGADGEHATYRVVQEGLTNAAKHAPGERVTVALAWQPDTLLVSVVNPTRSRTEPAKSGGTGLTGLEERVRLAGGLLHVRDSEREFRLVAMLPVRAAEQPVRTDVLLEPDRLTSMGNQ